MKFKRHFLSCTLLVLLTAGKPVSAQQIPGPGNGYRLWLKYNLIVNKDYLQACRGKIKQIIIAEKSPVLKAAKEELQTGISGLSGTNPLANAATIALPSVIAGTPGTNPAIKKLLAASLKALPDDGFIIKTLEVNAVPCIIIASNNDTGVLYGVFHFLRLLQTETPLANIDIKSAPKIQWRTLNHWDNADGTIERGYAGVSLWKWKELPGTISPRYKDYARANASIGINAVVLNNVNSDPVFLTAAYLQKVAALAGVFRPYGIRVLLSVNFASPITLGKLSTADPLNPGVQQWWNDKADEIYRLIPDFGGFLVKANSEGQPGPKDYNRSHTDGANMMATAVAPHKGVVMWRAFVYGISEADRAKQAYDEFIGFNGKFNNNVFLQIKNGPLDFQPREPFSPLFGAMPATAQMMELQVTQEYLGHSTHLVYLAPMYKEVLMADTYAGGRGSTIARVLDGTLQGQKITGLAGVANTGSDSAWTGHPIAQANWYALGRLAWDYNLSAGEIAAEWIKMTLTKDAAAVKTIMNIMMGSREALVNYQTPLGLHVLCDGDHFNPRPEMRGYYHKADTAGLGYNRTATGSNGAAQYFKPLSAQLNNINTCPENLITWFHHVPWDHKMRSGRIFWDELCFKYYSGVNQVRQMQKDWASVHGKIDKPIFEKVTALLARQEDEAVWWRDKCLWYFAKYSRKPIPPQYEQPRYPDGKRTNAR